MVSQQNKQDDKERREAIEQAKILKILIEMQQVNIILNTFIKAFKRNSVRKEDDVWYLHGNFNLGGTVSGRLSCIAGWTDIVTENGYKPIRKLTLKDKVWTHKERFQPITQLVFKGYENMYHVRLCNGEVLTCTIDHRLLLSTGQWQSLEEIINVGIQNLDPESRQHFERTQAISQQSSNVDSTKNSGTSRDHVSQCISNTLSKSISGRVQDNQSGEILNFQDGQQKPNEGKNSGSTSQLGRRVQRLQRLSNYFTQWKKTICASGSNDESPWFARITRNLVCSSYRHRSNEQQSGQSSRMHQGRAQKYPSLAGPEQSIVEIEKINYCGSLGVYDLSIKEDESYLACGVYSHNSSGPNLQNIPSNTKKRFGKLIKKCFISPPGWLFAGADFSSLEDKISALTTRDPNKLKVYEEGYDGHCLRAYSYFGSQMPDIDNTLASINSIETKYPHLRQDSKGPTFCLTYQGTKHSLINNLGIIPERAEEIETRYHELYAVADKWVQDKLYTATKTGYVTGAFDLRLRTPILKQTVLNTPKTPYEAKAEGRTAGNMLGQSYGLLNNRAAIEFQERVINSEFAEDILPCAHIHDAQYFLIRNSVDVVEWFNRNLVECMSWQDLPELVHPVVHLGASVDLFYPHWGNPTSLPNDASAAVIYALC